ncbi:MAG: translation elongation factor Ts [Acidimicrobiales bacterium]
MAEISAKDVQALRRVTGAGMMDCKKALQATDGDQEAAVQWLRERGIAKTEGLAGRANEQGAVAIAADGNRAALVQLKAETDFSAKADDFKALVKDLAGAVLAGGVEAVEARKDDIDTLRIAKKENIELGQVALFEAAEGHLLDTYLHQQDGRGVVGVIIEASGVDQETLHDIALHIAFAKPAALSRDEIPAETVEKERAALLEITKAEGKPEAAWPKIVDGRINAWYKDSVLLEQGVHGEKETVEQRIGAGRIVRFALATIGA